MDWTMIANADGPVMRLQTLYYLLKNRYQFDVDAAAYALCNDTKENVLYASILNELRTEIEQPTNDLGMGEIFNDSDVRSYFIELLSRLETQKGYC